MNSASLTLLLGISCAALSGFGYNLGIALQKKAARVLPRIRGASIRVSLQFLLHRGWLVGGVMIGFGWVMRFVALLLAPIAVAVPVSTSFLALQAWFAHNWFGEKLRRRELLGTGACILGLALIGLSLNAEHDISSRTIRLVALILALIAIAILAWLALLISRIYVCVSGVALSISAGLLFSATGTLTKVLGIELAQGKYGMALVALLALLVFGAIAIALIQDAHQSSRSMVMVPIMNVLADGVPVALSTVVFGEGWPRGELAVVRALGLAIILLGTWALSVNSSDKSKS